LQRSFLAIIARAILASADNVEDKYRFCSRVSQGTGI